MKSLHPQHLSHGGEQTKKASEYVIAVKRNVKTYSWVHEIEGFHRNLNKGKKGHPNKF